MTRTGNGRGPCTWGRARSPPTASCQAMLTGLAAARKNRRASSPSPLASESRSATACSAATDMPWADVGWGDGLEEGEELFGVGRRVVAVVPEQRQDPPVLLLRQQHEASGPARL